jgi:hypothetical protein
LRLLTGPALDRRRDAGWIGAGLETDRHARCMCHPGHGETRGQHADHDEPAPSHAPT